MLIDTLGFCLYLCSALLPGLTVLLFISNIDDFLLDILYVVRLIGTRLFCTVPPIVKDASDLQLQPLVNIAVFIPAWDEADVIADMLLATLARYDHSSTRIFVGVYPNDPATAAAVDSINNPRVHRVVTPKEGPTSKADCLNALWHALPRIEASLQDGWRAQAILLHDAEDLVSPFEPGVISYWIRHAGMVQLPVIPLVVPSSPWISGHYLDEFAEAHGRDMVVRSWLGAGIPGAGVGCAFDRSVLHLAEKARGGLPFHVTSATEDYELALSLNRLGVKQRFVRLAHSPYLRTPVGTSAYFPATFETAVRQKSRWQRGIALQGADEQGWQGNWASRWFLLRDRKALICAWLNLLTLAILSLWSLYWLWLLLDTNAVHYAALVEANSLSALFLWLNGGFALYRSVVRAIFVGNTYGWRQALLSIPRQMIAHSVNVCASARAIQIYLKARTKGKNAAWEKTRHHFPPSEN
jgi:bacteriophage N4 adsorption protein B